METSALSATEVQNLKLLLALAVGLVSPVFVGMLSLFVKVTIGKMLTKFETVIAEVSGLKTTVLLQGKEHETLAKEVAKMSHIGNEWLVMKERVEQGLAQIKDLKTSLDDVVILKRDQKTIWKRMDELRSELRGGRHHES